jgi:CDP-paratose 2-epimerase
VTSPRRVLITGGAGFIGVNLAALLAEDGWAVTIYDNLSRSGTERNLEWIQRTHHEVKFHRADILDKEALRTAVRAQDAVFHLAAQVAVTTSMADPETDFEVNARGTLNVLEAIRTQAPKAMTVFASTNKVYGGLEGWKLEKQGARWLPESGAKGVDESEILDFHSPYGCSKGAADQYVRDYSRVYGLRTVVLRQSCIYGAHQYGNEDQGWVAHFVYSMLDQQPITIFGDGFQVRDLLDVRDLCRLYMACLANFDAVNGQVFNVGGGPENARSVIEVLHSIEQLMETDAHYTHDDWRPGDQLFYVSDIARLQESLGWRPQFPFEEGLEHLVAWVRAERAAAGRS